MAKKITEYCDTAALKCFDGDVVAPVLFDGGRQFRSFENDIMVSDTCINACHVYKE